MAHDWTDEQKRAIEATDKTVLLSAAAGSGKTATLTERLIRMITRDKDPLDITRILVVTFTRDAAEELRVRISNALDKALMENPQKEHLSRAALLLPTAKIRTIDSFCNDLVKGHTDLLGIKPHYRVPDETEEQLLSEELLDELLTDAFYGTYAPEGLDVALLTECTVGARNEGDLVKLLLDLYEKLLGYPDGLAILKENATEMRAQRSLPFFETKWGKVIKDAACEMLSDHKASLKRAIDNALDDPLFASTLLPLSKELLLFLGEAETAAALSYSHLRSHLLKTLEKKDRDPAASDKKLSEGGFLAKHYRKMVLKDLEDFTKKYLLWEEKDISEAMEKNAVNGMSIYLLLSEFDRRFSEEKRARGLCTYADLERFAYTLLHNEDGSTTPLAKELAASFDAVCIDEYQDVNDLQHSIFGAIAGKRNLFMVGDIKQSIYYFRGARPDIFTGLRRTMPSFDEGKDSTVLYLTRNFRTLPHLIAFNNAVFDFLFGTLGESIGYEESDRLTAAREPMGSPVLPRATYLHTTEGGAASEWDLLAERIKARLEEGKTKADGSPLMPSDIAVLYHSGKAYRFEIADALRRRGIPVCTEDTQSFFSFPDVLLAMCLLNVVNNPHRDVYLAGLLRSPLYTVTMEELLSIKKEAEEGATLFEALTAYTASHGDFSKGKRALEDIRTYRQLSEGMAADKLCRLLFERSMLYAITDEEGKSRLRVIYDYARTLQSNRFFGLYHFVSHLNELSASRRSLGAKRMLGSADGVKISTMHGSKGLEYPVTFVVGTIKQASPKQNPILFHAELGTASYIRDASGLALLKNPIMNALDCRVRKEEADEALRVLYVALTRAKEELYITAHSRSKPSDIETKALLLRAFPSPSTLRYASQFLRILAAAENHPSLCSFDTVTSAELSLDAQAPSAPNTVKEETEKTKEHRALIEEYEKRFSYVYPYAAESQTPSKLSVSVLNEREGNGRSENEEKRKEETVPFFISHRKTSVAKEAGIATHLFLQFCSFKALAAKDEKAAREKVKCELERLTDTGFMRKEDAELVRQNELAGFALSPLLSRILESEQIFRELRFHTVLHNDAVLNAVKGNAEKTPEDVLVQGVIDLVLIGRNGEITLCDYKTDRLLREALASDDLAEKFFEERYAVQLSYYAAAAEKMFGKRPASLEIFSLHAGKSFEIKPVL